MDSPQSLPSTEKFERQMPSLSSKVKKNVHKHKNQRFAKGLKRVEEQYKDAVRSAANTDVLLQENVGYLEAEDPMEKTYSFKQKDIVKEVDVATASKRFELNLNEFGPYTIDYTRNGRKLLIGGRKGHVASMDWRTGHLDCELHLNETVNAVQYFHNDHYFAVAQKRYVFVYDQTGVELHRMKQHIDCTLLDFLPYHLLLTTAGNNGHLRYHDVSTGELVSDARTKMGPTQAMKQNPWNAVMHLGHTNGVVSMWAPGMGAPLVKLQTARGPIRDLAIDREGKYMAVSGSDKSLKIWDLRKLQPLETYFTPTPASSLDISDTGLLAVGWDPHVSVWKDMFKSRQEHPYMKHLLPGLKVENVKYVPFEDVLGVGHKKGISSVIIPGSGEANYDALELNPYESVKQKQQTEVKTLINKLSPDTISLDPNFIGTVDRRAASVRTSKVNGMDKPQEEQPESKSFHRKKSDNVIDERRMRQERNLRMEQEARERKNDEEEEEKDDLDAAFSRFK